LKPGEKIQQIVSNGNIVTLKHIFQLQTGLNKNEYHNLQFVLGNGKLNSEAENSLVKRICCPLGFSQTKLWEKFGAMADFIPLNLPANVTTHIM